jgi:hypothetical protein
MVKEYSKTYTFPYKWEHVCAGFWVKYPNPFSKHVISEDVFHREIIDDNVLVSKRLLVKERMFHIPKWAETVVPQKQVYVVEEAHCDPNKQTLTTYTRNFTLTSMMTVLEKCEYSKDPNDPESTICKKQAHIYSPVLFGGRAFEQFGLTRFKKNAERASKGLQWIIERYIINKLPLPRLST